MVVEMLGATATMLYGLNIIMDPVHEELEMEPNAPGITEVTAVTLCKALTTGRALAAGVPARCAYCRPLEGLGRPCKAESFRS